MDGTQLIEELIGDGSARELARKTGVSKSAISKLRRGECVMDLRTLRQLAKAFPNKRDLFLFFFSETVLPNGQ